MKNFFGNLDWSRWGELKKYYDKFGSESTITPGAIKIGDVITFVYHGDYSPQTKVRWVYVLNPNYKDRLHGLDMTLVDPKMMYDIITQRMHTVPDPQAFYNSPKVKQMVKVTDSYRTYIIQQMPYIMKMGFDKSQP